jgi:hypothetical protein
MKYLGKQKKGKEKEEKNLKRGPGKQFGPVPQLACGPANQNRTGTLILPFTH